MAHECSDHLNCATYLQSSTWQQGRIFVNCTVCWFVCLFVKLRTAIAERSVKMLRGANEKGITHCQGCCGAYEVRFSAASLADSRAASRTSSPNVKQQSNSASFTTQRLWGLVPRDTQDTVLWQLPHPHTHPSTPPTPPPATPMGNFGWSQVRFGTS